MRGDGFHRGPIVRELDFGIVPASTGPRAGRLTRARTANGRVRLLDSSRHRRRGDDDSRRASEGGARFPVDARLAGHVAVTLPSWSVGGSMSRFSSRRRTVQSGRKARRSAADGPRSRSALERVPRAEKRHAVQRPSHRGHSRGASDPSSRSSVAAWTEPSGGYVRCRGTHPARRLSSTVAGRSRSALSRGIDQAMAPPRGSAAVAVASERGFRSVREDLSTAARPHRAIPRCHVLVTLAGLPIGRGLNLRISAAFRDQSAA